MTDCKINTEEAEDILDFDFFTTGNVPLTACDFRIMLCLYCTPFQ